MKKRKCFNLLLIMMMVMVFFIPAPLKAAQLECADKMIQGDALTESEAASTYYLQQAPKLSGESPKASSMSFSKEIKMHTGTGGDYVYTVANMPSNGKIKNITISNKKIATVTAYNNQINIKPKKPGNATLKFTVKYGSKKQNFSAKLKIYKYSNPIASYKVNGKEMKSKFAKTSSYNMNWKKAKKIKFIVKAKSGWTITSFFTYNNGKSKYYNTNSPTINVKPGNSVQINFTDQKTGLVENIVIWFRK